MARARRAAKAPVGDGQMHGATPVTAPLISSDGASQSDRATLAATGWNFVGAEPQRARRFGTRPRAAVADRSPWRRRAQAAGSQLSAP